MGPNMAEGSNDAGGLLTADRTSSGETYSDRPNQESDGIQGLSTTLAVTRLEKTETPRRGDSAKTEAEQDQLQPARHGLASKDVPCVAPGNTAPTPAPNVPREIFIYYGDDGFPASLLDWRRVPKDDYGTARCADCP